MTQESKTDRAIALWALACMFRSDPNKDPELERIGQACDKAAIRYATEAGTNYNEQREAVENCSIETAYETITS